MWVHSCENILVKHIQFKELVTLLANHMHSGKLQPSFLLYRCDGCCALTLIHVIAVQKLTLMVE